MLIELFKWFSTVAFFVYGIEYMVNGTDNTEVIDGGILVILAIALLVTLTYF